MANLSIDQLKPLMVLAKDVHDRTGRLLAVNRTALTEHHMLVFRTWGIGMVDVLDEGEESVEQHPKSVTDVTTTSIESVIESLKPRFCLVDLEHPLMQELLRLAAHKKVMADDR